MTSYSIDEESTENDSTREFEVRCNHCHGSGSDRDGADCIKCEGWGTLIEYY